MLPERTEVRDEPGILGELAHEVALEPAIVVCPDTESNRELAQARDEGGSEREPSDQRSELRTRATREQRSKPIDRRENRDTCPQVVPDSRRHEVTGSDEVPRRDEQRSHARRDSNPQRQQASRATQTKAQQRKADESQRGFDSGWPNFGSQERILAHDLAQQSPVEHDAGLRDAVTGAVVAPERQRTNRHDAEQCQRSEQYTDPRDPPERRQPLP